MVTNRFSHIKGEFRRSWKDLFPWLALVPFVLASLYFFGSLALVWPRYDTPIDTRSRLLADYRAWLYDNIPAINIEALVQDILKEQKAAGTVEPTVVQGVFLVPPTATPGGPTATQLVPAVLPSRTATLPPPPTETSQPSATQAPPTATLVPTKTKTATSTRAPVLPTRTNTPVPPTAQPPTATNIPPTRTATLKPPTATPTLKPTTASPPADNTPVPTPIPPTPTQALVHPIAENDANSVPDGGGCLASFGYLNDNPQPVDIPVGSQNQLNIPGLPAPLVTHFLVGRMYDVFQVTWTAPGDLIWTVNGSTATVKWCNP